MAGIPKPNSPRFLERVREVLEVALGQRGGAMDRFVSIKDLVDAGLAKFVQGGRVYVTDEGIAAANNPLQPAKDLSEPPAITNLSVNAALASIIVAFDNPHFKYTNHAHSEIWRSQTNDLSTAVLRGTAPGGLYADEIGNTDVTYYYWVRAVSQANIKGPYNAVLGTSATSAQIIGANVAAGTITADKLNVNQLSAISADLGSVTAGSMNINNRFLVDSLGNATIRSATTGARLEIQNNVIRVYDANGTLRVELGQLSV